MRRPGVAAMTGDPDPRGLIRESYRIAGITEQECRSIFLDWAVGLPQDADPKTLIGVLLDRHAAGAEHHPMTQVLREGLERPARLGRRGGRRGRSPR